MNMNYATILRQRLSSSPGVGERSTVMSQFVCFIIGAVVGGIAAVIVIYDVEIVRNIRIFRQ